MFSTLRTRFGIPGVISVIALVFAMFGGAYAASNSSGGGKATASAKAKKGPRGPKGATGPAGPAGPKGDAGAAGAAGSPGQSVTTAPIAAGNVECPAKEGGTKLTSASGTEKVCNGAKGKEGSPWTAGGTLPSGKTETGTWGFGPLPAEGTEGQATEVVASFPIPLAAPLANTETCGLSGEPACAAHYINPAGEEVVQREGATEVTQPSAECTGTVGEPSAEPGNLCIYARGGSFAHSRAKSDSRSLFSLELEFGAGKTGALGIFYPVQNGSEAQGSWAVTAP